MAGAEALRLGNGLEMMNRRDFIEIMSLMSAGVLMLPPSRILAKTKDVEVYDEMLEVLKSLVRSPPQATFLAMSGFYFVGQSEGMTNEPARPVH